MPTSSQSEQKDSTKYTSSKNVTLTKNGEPKSLKEAMMHK